MRGNRWGIGAIAATSVIAACGGGAATPPKAPLEAKKPDMHQASRACTGPGSGKGAKPLGAPHISSTVALASAGAQTIAYIADEDGQTIQTVDVDTGAEIASTPLEGKPSQLLVMPDGRVLVAIRNQS